MKTLFFLLMALLFSGEAYTADANSGSKDDKKVKAMKHMETSSRSWLGVSVRDVTADQAKELGLKKAEGAYVADVVKKSPADSAGIQKGDVIVGFGDRAIYDADGLVNAVRKTESGTKVEVAVIRKGEKKNLQATIAKPKRRMSFAFIPHESPHHVRVFKGPSLGMSLIPLNPQLGKYFEAPDVKGLLVEKVEEGSAAEKAGFQAGDVITKVGKKQVGKVHEFRSELAEYSEGDKVDVEIIRRSSRKTLTLEVEESDEGGFEFSIGEINIPNINIEIPEFDFRLDDLRPELDRLEREIDRLRERIEQRIKQRIIREERALPGT